MGTPAVTVVIPAFNAERHIGEALGSIRDQTTRDFEVVLVDDGSVDGTLREVERFSGVLDLRVVKQANAGPAAARNAAIRLARGRYCAFLDADDVMLPERLAAQIERLDAEPDMALVHTDLMTFDDGGVIHQTRHAFSSPCGGRVLDRLLLDNFITTSTVMASRERLLEVGLFGEERRVSEDFELWLRMAARWTVGFIDRPLVRYRRRPGSLSDDKLVTARCALEVIESFWQEHPQHRSEHPVVYRHSRAEHLATAGAAALAQGHRSTAVGYVTKSLWQDPLKRRAWKTLISAMLPVPPATRRRSLGTPGAA
jgi:glycosyltransferase involved in cell wall biosynthesis